MKLSVWLLKRQIVPSAVGGDKTKITGGRIQPYIHVQQVSSSQLLLLQVCLYDLLVLSPEQDHFQLTVLLLATRASGGKVEQ